METKKSIGTREEVKTARAPINEDGKPYRWWEETEKWGDRQMTRDQRTTLEHVFETNRFPDVSMLFRFASLCFILFHLFSFGFLFFFHFFPPFFFLILPQSHYVDDLRSERHVGARV